MVYIVPHIKTNVAMGHGGSYCFTNNTTLFVALMNHYYSMLYNGYKSWLTITQGIECSTLTSLNHPAMVDTDLLSVASNPLFSII